MKMSTRYIIVMIISVLLNSLLYEIAEIFNLPIWLDSTGTALSALALEPVAGILVGLANNFFIAIVNSSPSSIIYFGVSALLAIVVGVNMRRRDKSIKFRIITTIIYVILAASIVSTLITIWRTGGISDAYWELYFYKAALSMGMPEVLCYFIGIFVVKAIDTVVTAVFVAVAYFALPKKLKNNDLLMPVIATSKK